MTLLKHITAATLSILCVGSAHADLNTRYPGRIVLAQHRVVAREVRVVPVQQQQSQQSQQRSRRFVTPANGTVYPHGVYPQYSAPNAGYQRVGRMSADERRALRRQINDANKGIYRNNR